METLISILRGINVSGKNKIEMSALKALYKELKFTEVITYIQSGNVIFKANTKQPNQHLAKKIEKAIHEKYDLNVPVIIRTAEEIKHAVAINPFLTEGNTDPAKMHITFLAEDPQQAAIESITKLDYSPDKFVIINKEVFLYCPSGYGTTKLSNTFFENKLKVKATTRNWKTVNKLAELAKE